ncbi:unnamed protein product [Nezara viridula]|uniref:Phosphatidylinositol transfer protein N-terminal domain-containing protein n=1 Tax=Nezara viridula TaxID=85310 RepID=A0A9P0MIX5_NEZVI|nr:unnamed protein product [Nezara viridula]
MSPKWIKMLITEFRIPMPFTLDEYQRGQMYTTIQTSLLESSNEEGVEVLKNEPFSDNADMPEGYSSGDYTKKVYNFANRFPFFIRALAPKSAMQLTEESWNSFPYTRTILTNDKMKEDFFIKIDTIYCEGKPEQENAHELSQDLLDTRKVVQIDIAKDTLSNAWKRDTPEPSQFTSAEVNRGPLATDWIQTAEPIMTCYKLVQVKFKWFGLQRTIESFIMKTERKLFTSFHRCMFVWIDDWFVLTPNQLKNMENKADKQLSGTPSRGMSRYQTSAYTIK